MTPITVNLTPEYDEYWQNCNEIGHEMIVNTTGRRIFPTMEFQISGLDQNKSYKLSMHFEHFDNLHYRFDNASREYISAISPYPKDPPRIVFHPNGTQTGSEWMSDSVRFDAIGLTRMKELEAKSERYVHLFSGHLYQPVLTVHGEGEPIQSFRIDHMVFMANTAYQREGIINYKISINKLMMDRKQSDILESAVNQLKI